MQYESREPETVTAFRDSEGNIHSTRQQAADANFYSELGGALGAAFDASDGGEPTLRFMARAKYFMREYPDLAREFIDRNSPPPARGEPHVACSIIAGETTQLCVRVSVPDSDGEFSGETVFDVPGMTQGFHYVHAISAHDNLPVTAVYLDGKFMGEIRWLKGSGFYQYWPEGLRKHADDMLVSENIDTVKSWIEES